MSIVSEVFNLTSKRLGFTSRWKLRGNVEYLDLQGPFEGCITNGKCREKAGSITNYGSASQPMFAQRTIIFQHYAIAIVLPAYVH